LFSNRPQRDRDAVLVLRRTSRRTRGRLGHRGGGLQPDPGLHLLSAAVLVGLVLNSSMGWWWADSIVGLVIAVFAVREGVEAWKGDACVTSAGMILQDDREDEPHPR
jgi:hypothetical protein